MSEQSKKHREVVRPDDAIDGRNTLGKSIGPDVATHSHRPVYTCGEPVEDEYVTPLSKGASGSNKTRCTFRRQRGGAVVNGSRAILSYGGNVRPCLLTGDDRRSDELIEELGDEFPSIRVARAACQARRSIIVNGHCYTCRDPLDPDRLPKELFTCSDEAAAVLIAPLSAENHEFVGNMLRSHPKSVWQPSAEQVQDARQTYRLMNSATITVMNQSEAEILTGENDPMEAIMVCRDNMDRGLIVTMKSGAVGWFNGDWAYASAPVVNSVVREVAAGDWFAGIFTLAWSGDVYDFAKAMALGQAAAARYVGDLPPLACLDELAEWYSQQPKKPIPGKVPQHLGYRRVASAAIATLATAAIIVFLLLRASSF